MTTEAKFEVDNWVRSVAVGSKESFVGRVQEVRGCGFIIVDSNRKRWFRTEQELSLATRELVQS